MFDGSSQCTIVLPVECLGYGLVVPFLAYRFASLVSNYDLRPKHSLRLGHLPYVNSSTTLVVVFIEPQKRPRGAPRMRYGRSVGKALDAFDLDHNKGPELAADRLALSPAWRAMLHIGILLDRKLAREHPLRPPRHMKKSREALRTSS